MPNGRNFAAGYLDNSCKEKAKRVQRLFRRRLSLHRKKGAIMKRSVVLLIDADADTSSSVLEVASLTNREVRFARKVVRAQW
jgi:hypothetical protein